MNAFNRLLTTLADTANAVLDRFDEAGLSMDYAYELEREQLIKAQRACDRVCVTGERLIALLAPLAGSADQLLTLTECAAREGDFKAARESLARAAVMTAGRESIERQANEMADERARLAVAIQSLEFKVRSLAIRKEVLKAHHRRSRDRAELDACVAQLHAEVHVISDAVRRATDTVSLALSKVNRIDRLLSSELLYDMGQPLPQIAAELAAVRESPVVDGDLVALLRRLGISRD